MSLSNDVREIIHPITLRKIRHEDYISGIGKAMAILECFDKTKHRLNISTAAKRTGITRAAARRHLLTLVYLGYLETDGKYFYLTPKILKFSGSYLINSLMPKVCQSFVNLLNVQTGWIYSVMVLEGYEAITIARSQTLDAAERVNPDGLTLGSRLPAHATSAGKVLLAYCTQDVQIAWLKQYPLQQLTYYTCTDATRFLSLLSDIRQQGWCYSREEHELGVHALAVPLYDEHQTVIAAINIVSQTSKIGKESLLQDILPLLLGTASDITKVMKVN